jgi:MoaA/NifB/PqqE/SkfB family radical SAM enzyme
MSINVVDPCNEVCVHCAVRTQTEMSLNISSFTRQQQETGRLAHYKISTHTHPLLRNKLTQEIQYIDVTK